MRRGCWSGLQNQPATDCRRAVALEAVEVEYSDGGRGWFGRATKTAILHIGNRRLQWASSTTIW